MLEEQDLVKIEQIVDSKTSDIRQDVSILKQDVSELKTGQSRIEILLENMNDTLQLTLENYSDTKEQLIDYKDTKKHVFDNHENRITRLEVAFTKNMARKKKKSA